MLRRVDEKYPDIKYMRPAQAKFLSDLITRNTLDNLLELGTFQGKGTAYLALIQEERGRGHVTTLDRITALKKTPNVYDVIAGLGMSHRVTVRLAQRSFTHTLMQMLEEKPRPIFDFVYLDGAHTWDGTGFCFLLIDKLLRPGGWVVFDDLDWTIAKSRKKLAFAKDYSDEEKQTQLVRKVWEILVPEAGYVNLQEWKGWGIAQKSENPEFRRQSQAKTPAF